MKRLYVFDLDNTIRSTNFKKILPNTKKLIQTLASNDNYKLVLATGRGPSKLDVLGDLENVFDYKILINGALTLKKDQTIYEHPISKDDVASIMNAANLNQTAIGLVGKTEEVVSNYDEWIKKAFDDFVNKKPVVDPLFYLNNKVYQIWVYHPNEADIKKYIETHFDLDIYNWHAGGFDIVKKGVSKANALKELKNKYPDYEVIAVGDGHNDLEMIGIADKGILMSNSRWQNDARTRFDLLAPDVDSDTLFEFFQEHNLL